MINKVSGGGIALAQIGVAHLKQNRVVALAAGLQVDVEPIEIQRRVDPLQGLIITGLQQQEGGLANIVARPALADEIQNDLGLVGFFLIEKRLCQAHGGGLQLGRFGIFVQHYGKGLLRFGIELPLELRLPQGREALRHTGITG